MSEELIKMEDLLIETYGSIGGVNHSDNGVRITHIPTGKMVECDSERSLYKNKLKGWNELLKKLEDNNE